MPTIPAMLQSASVQSRVIRPAFQRFHAIEASRKVCPQKNRVVSINHIGLAECRLRQSRS